MSSEKICIYCGSRGPFSEEHALPYSLGQFKGFPELKDRICRECNSTRISVVEDQFLHSTPEAFLKKCLGIRGRKGHKPVNIFKRGSAGAPPIDFIGIDSKMKIRILLECIPGKQNVKEVDEQIIFIDQDGASYPYRVPSRLVTWEQIIEDARKKLSLPKGGYSAITRGSDEFHEKIKALTASSGVKFHLEKPPDDTIMKNPKIWFRFTDMYFRAIAKIAYHYFLTIIDAYHGHEDLFNPLRNFIMNGGVRDDFIRPRYVSILKENPSWWTHIIEAFNEKGSIFVDIQFFVSSAYTPIKYMVKLNRDHTSCAIFNRKCHRFTYYQPIQRIGKYYGELSEVESKQLPLFTGYF